MNVINSLGGKGERFSKEGYAMPKPLIEILDKRMIDYVIENLILTSDDSVYIIYNYGLDNHGFSDTIKTKYYYYRKIIEYGVVNYSFEEYERDIYDAICYIPFFTSIWFGTTPQDELIDKNFPYFLLAKCCIY